MCLKCDYPLRPSSSQSSVGAENSTPTAQSFQSNPVHKTLPGSKKIKPIIETGHATKPAVRFLLPDNGSQDQMSDGPELSGQDLACGAGDRENSASETDSAPESSGLNIPADLKVEIESVISANASYDLGLELARGYNRKASSGKVESVAKSEKVSLKKATQRKKRGRPRKRKLDLEDLDDLPLIQRLKFAAKTPKPERKPTEKVLEKLDGMTLRQRLNLLRRWPASKQILDGIPGRALGLRPCTNIKNRIKICCDSKKRSRPSKSKKELQASVRSKQVKKEKKRAPSSEKDGIKSDKFALRRRKPKKKDCWWKKKSHGNVRGKHSQKTGGLKDQKPRKKQILQNFQSYAFGLARPDRRRRKKTSWEQEVRMHEEARERKTSLREQRNRPSYSLTDPEHETWKLMKEEKAQELTLEDFMLGKIPVPIGPRDKQTLAYTRFSHYTCPTCLRVFVQKEDFNSHLYSPHAREALENKSPDPDSLEILQGIKDSMLHCCRFCSRIFYEAAWHREHEGSHENVVDKDGAAVSQCPHCKSTYKTPQHLEDHLKHMTGFQRCGHCGIMYGCGNFRVKHRSLHRHGKICDTCGILFDSLTPEETEEHCKLHPRPTFHCTECGHTFDTSAKYTEHARRHHLPQTKPYQCDVCAATFKANCQLEDHKLRHSAEKTKQCHICGKKFRTKAQLTYHFKSHSDDKSDVSFSCPHCPKVYNNKDSYRRHLEKKHGDDDKQVYVCQHCGKVSKIYISGVELDFFV